MRKVDLENIDSFLFTGDNKNGSYNHINKIVLDKILKFVNTVEKYHDLSNVKTIFDIGSLNGVESIYFSKLFPLSFVYSFEPNPNNYKLTANNQLPYNNTDCVNVALGNKNGKIKFNIFDNPGVNSILDPEYKDPVKNKVGELTVDIITAEDFCKSNAITNVDLILIDVQGYELEVFKGFGDVLKNTKGILTECVKNTYYKNQPTFFDVKSYLETVGFFTETKDIEGTEEDITFIKK
jgi:FkbM family methyltransferase